MDTGNVSRRLRWSGVVPPLFRESSRRLLASDGRARQAVPLDQWGRQPVYAATP